MAPLQKAAIDASSTAITSSSDTMSAAGSSARAAGTAQMVLAKLMLTVVHLCPIQV